MAKTLALVFGIVFVAVGLLAFIPNPIVGPGALFETNRIHDMVHLLSGVFLIVMSFSGAASSVLGLRVMGIVYGLVTVLGFVTVGTEGGEVLGLITMNAADHVLHLLLTAVLLWAGFGLRDRAEVVA